MDQQLFDLSTASVAHALLLLLLMEQLFIVSF
jgi:hypothetical protein